MTETPTTPTATKASVGSVAMFTIDCADAGELAAFYSKMLGMGIAYQDDNVAMITGENGPAIGFGKVDNFHAAPWPDNGSDKQFHLDIKVDDIPTAEAEAIQLGATVPDHQPGETWRVLLDPAGHPFCLTVWSA